MLEKIIMANELFHKIMNLEIFAILLEIRARSETVSNSHNYITRYFS